MRKLVYEAYEEGVVEGKDSTNFLISQIKKENQI
jgi:hypothetical protein